MTAPWTPRFVGVLLLSSCAATPESRPTEPEPQAAAAATDAAPASQSEPEPERDSTESIVSWYSTHIDHMNLADPAEIDPADPEQGPAGDRKGEFFVAPVPFRSPQIGWGLALLGGYIFKTDSGSDTPASTAFGGGFYSENGSGGGALGVKLHTPGDEWRLLGAVGAARVKYKFYGVGPGAGDNGRFVDFSTDAAFVATEALHKVAPSVFVGPLFNYGESNTSTPNDGLIPPGLLDQFDATVSTLGIHAQWDSRDDNFYPRAGVLSDVSVKGNNSAWGATFDYENLELSYAQYKSLDEESVLAWTGYGVFTAGDAPFYALGQIDMRGYVPGRYRDRAMLTAEAEYRRHIWKRLGGVVFANAGQVGPSLGEFKGDNMLYGAGVGVRIRLTDKNPLNYRIDVAHGKHGVQWYFSVGEAF